VTPLLLIALGVAALGAGFAVLVTFGSRYRIGRLLATAPNVSVAEALAIAASGRHAYVRIEGRIDSDAEFEDADHRPLVLRRTRLATRGGLLGGWRAFETNTEVVPFVIREGLDAITIEGDALGDGLVVVPRRSDGVAGDLGDRAPTGVATDAPARATIEQVSSVEHAIVLGVPMSADGDPPARMTAGQGRPLVLTTLEIPEAMRVLTGGAVGRSRLAAACLITGGGLLAVGVLWWLVSLVGSPAVAFAASPGSSILPGSDTRSSGQGPGLVGDPAFAILAVAAIALLAIAATTLYVRLTAPRRDAAAPPRGR
jgi:hypothetical protein